MKKMTARRGKLVNQEVLRIRKEEVRADVKSGNAAGCDIPVEGMETSRTEGSGLFNQTVGECLKNREVYWY